jgi:DNA phosphorothioation system restriction enzyme
MTRLSAREPVVRDIKVGHPVEQLSDLHLDITYRSDSGNVVTDFYVPCLLRSTLYLRAAGYFTSQGLSLAAKGLARLIKTGGKVRLVVSPFLSDEDVEAITRGYSSREDVLRGAARKALEDDADQLVRDRLSALAWLISSGSLDIKLAFRVDATTGRLGRGLYHEKIGLFGDEANNHVAFTGSQNETTGGLVDNFESIDVFCSWKDPDGRVQRKLEAFNRLWSNHTKGLSVIDFNEVSREVLERFKGEVPPGTDPEEPTGLTVGSLKANRPHLPNTIALRDYQETAIKSWFQNNGTGILEMATGTGKTIVALGIATSLYTKINLQALIVICPYKHLVTQWRRECERFGIEPLLAYETRTRWYDDLTHRLSSLHTNPDSFLCVLTTNATFASDSFQQRVKYFPDKTLIVADEVHNLGASRLSEVLPDGIRLRLGLSATPERWFDPHGTAKLISYFGKILEPRLGIREAIRLKALVPYRYYPILVALTHEETAEYLDLSARIARVAGLNRDPDDPVLTALLMQRARLIGTAANKLTALRQFAQQRPNGSQMLFYCGDGSVESEADQLIRRQVDEVTRILGSEIGLRVGVYVAETELDERDQLRADLESGRLQGLVAIRCLDEGVDIPAVRTAVILASSTNPRQFVQRRGRVLRRHPGKDDAEIYDMIVVPPKEAQTTESERTLLRKELTRFAEFADIALNAGEARATILDLQRHFDLMDI